MSPAPTSQSMAASSKPCEPGQPRDHVSSHSDNGFPAQIRTRSSCEPNAGDSAVQLSAKAGQRVGREGGSRHIAYRSRAPVMLDSTRPRSTC
jgi:hypothetical protein